MIENFDFAIQYLFLVHKKIKEELIRRTEDACNNGFFDVSAFIISNKTFWGQDGLDFVLSEATKH